MKPAEFRQIREDLGLTQKELANVLGISGYMTIGHYETGFRNPSALIIAVMRILNDWPKKDSLRLQESLKAEAEKILRQKRKANR